MKKKDIKLFDKAIHKVKHLTQKIYNQKKEMDKEIKELKEIVEELYELFDDLSNGKNKIYIKNSSKTINQGLHNLKVVIRTDSGRLQTGKHYIGKFDVEYGDKKKYLNEITLTITEAKEAL